MQAAAHHSHPLTPLKTNDKSNTAATHLELLLVQAARLPRLVLHIIAQQVLQGGELVGVHLWRYSEARRFNLKESGSIRIVAQQVLQRGELIGVHLLLQVEVGKLKRK